MGAHGIAGTNRRIVEYTFQISLHSDRAMVGRTCPDNFIGRDIDRFPAWRSRKFTTTCRSCHSMMDPLRPAFSQLYFCK